MPSWRRTAIISELKRTWKEKRKTGQIFLRDSYSRESRKIPSIGGRSPKVSARGKLRCTWFILHVEDNFEHSLLHPYYCLHSSDRV